MIIDNSTPPSAATDAHTCDLAQHDGHVPLALSILSSPPWTTTSSPRPCGSAFFATSLSLEVCSNPRFLYRSCLISLPLEPSYNRHVSYCRRSQNRPRHRQRSCRQCSLARTKCSFHSRCNRCVTKGLNCSYDRPPAAHKAKPPTLDVSPLFPTWPLSPTCEGVAPPDAFGFEPDTSLADSTELLAVSELARVTPDFFSASANMLFAPVDTGFLIRLPISDPVAQHSATLVMQALRAFPQMMLRKPTFPPFIHSHYDWHPLPEPLAHCMSIAHIFVSPSVETRSFLWHSINREQQRFLEEASTWTNESI